MKKIIFLIRSLNVGGAERQLLTLLKALDRNRFEPVVVTFYSEGTLLAEFNTEHILVKSAAKRSRWDVIAFLFRLIKIIRTEKPDLVVSYLVAANLLAVTLQQFFKPAKIVISIRHSYLRKEDYDWLAAFLYSLENKIAGWSDLIIINSFIGAKFAKQRGIPAKKIVVIPNGIDTEIYHPDTAARIKSRQIFGLQQEDRVVGIIGRIDPVKDHLTFLNAANLVNQKYPGTRYLIVGSGDKQIEAKLKEQERLLGLTGKVIWIPSQKELLGAYNALDVCVSSSVGEGFSNVIAEAMACGIPCVVTDVGDSSQIVGESGVVIQSGNVQETADGILRLLEQTPEKRRNLGKQARKRILTHFSVDKMVLSTMQEFEKLG